MEEALAWMRDIMTKRKLTVNEMKDRVCKLPERKLDFLGIYVRTFPKDGTRLHWHSSLEEAG
jgi:hypothetical protein